MKLKFRIFLICLSFLAIGTFYSCNEDEPKIHRNTENQDKYYDDDDDDDDDSGSNWIRCGMCKGKGVCYFCHGDGTFPDDVTECRYCHGSGLCHKCDGSGRIYY